MHIDGVILNFASNSSSTHSLVFVDDPSDIRTTEYSEFGWDYFTAANKESKENYLAAILRNALSNGMGQRMANLVVKSLFPEAPEDGYVDHQSAWVLPLEYGGTQVDMDFFEDLKTYILQEKLVILGGNDNDENSHHLSGIGRDADIRNLPQDSDGYGFFCRKENDYWTLFNKYTGTTVRISFVESKFDKPTYPELIDIKLTGWCSKGCDFCYMDSTTKGVHADFNLIQRMAWQLKEAKVFQVALGGGEPTMHPEFIKIIRTFRQNGILPNFTSRSLHWLKNDKLRTEILELVGGFGFSVSNLAELQELNELLKEHGLNNNHRGHRVNVHLVMGTLTQQDFEEMLTYAAKEHVTLLLLGYKETGRGHTFQQIPYDSWLVDSILKVKAQNLHPSIAIDTVISEQFEAQLLNSGVPRWMLAKREGMFSCYIDAVEKKIAKSSFVQPEEMEPLMEKDRWGTPSFSTDILAKRFANY